jgi:hypothetical protein
MQVKKHRNLQETAPGTKKVVIEVRRLERLETTTLGGVTGPRAW